MTVKLLWVKLGIVDNIFFNLLNKDQKDLHEEDETDRHLKKGAFNIH